MLRLRIERILRRRRAKAQIARAIPPNALDCGRFPKFGPGLPIKMGSGGWPVEEPTQEELRVFLECLDQVPPSYFSSYKDPRSPDYGTEYTAVIRVRQWLELIDEAKLLAEPER